MIIDEPSIRHRFEAVCGQLDERGVRLLAAAEARAAGYGGIAAVSRATGIARSTIGRGLADLDRPALPPGQVRRAGSGRKPVQETDPMLWVSKSHAKLSDGLCALGHSVSPNTVGRLLREELGYSRQSNRKSLEGASHADRDGQFAHINAQACAFQAAGQPVISVDTKQKELIGPFKNGGSDCRPKGSPEAVNVHDFPDKTLGKVAPYGIYDPLDNRGWVSLGIDHDTAEFAVNAIRTWHERVGSKRYPGSERLLITADCGGSKRQVIEIARTRVIGRPKCGHVNCNLLLARVGGSWHYGVHVHPGDSQPRLASCHPVARVLSRGRKGQETHAVQPHPLAAQSP